MPIHEFLNLISHEIRTPLSSMREGIKLILDGSLGAINPEQERFLHLVDRNVDRLSWFVNTLFNFSQIHGEKINLKRDVFSPAELLEEIFTAMKELSQDKQIEIIPEIKGPLPLFSGDREQIKQLLINLIHRAFKSVGREGKVWVSVEPLANDKMVEICITDTGSNLEMPPARELSRRYHLRRKFQGQFPIFYHDVDYLINMDLVKKHGGRLTIEDENGRHVVRIRLPRQLT